MFSTRTLYWMPYLLLCLTVPASAGGPLERIARLEQQVGDLHQLQRDVVPLMERIETRLETLEQRSAGVSLLQSEIASLRTKVNELSQQQVIAGRQRAALEAELRTLRRAVDSPSAGNRTANSANPTSPFTRSAPQPKLFRGEYAPRSSRGPVSSAPPRRLGQDDAEYWRRLRDEARLSLQASRQRNGLSRW